MNRPYALGARADTSGNGRAVNPRSRVQDLVLVAQKIRVAYPARGNSGPARALVYALQPNHPTDEPAGIAARHGLLYGNGDAMIGINSGHRQHVPQLRHVGDARRDYPAL